MDDLAIKTSTVKDNATPGLIGRDNATALAGLAASFQDLLHKTGLRIESGLNDIADRAGISAIADRGEPVQAADDYGRDQADDGKDRFDNAQRGDDRSDRTSDTRGNDEGKKEGRDHGAEHREDRGDGRGAEHGQDHADDYDGDDGQAYAARDDAPANKDQGGDSQASGDGDGVEAAGEPTASDGDGQNTGTENASDGTGAVTAGTDAAVTQAGVSGEATNAVLGDMLAGGPAHTADGQASDQGKESASQGLVTATETVAAGPQNVSQTGAENMSATATEKTSQVTTTGKSQSDGTPNNHQSQAQSAADTQAQAGAADPSAVKVEAETDAPTTVESQAAGLAKAIGDGNRAQVNVQVTKEAEVLNSRPGATLSANTVISAEGSSQSSGGQNAGTHGQNAGTQTAQAQALAQQAQAGAVQNTGTQAAQAQAQATGDAKGLVQASTVSGASGGTAHSGGGEGAAQATTGNVSGSQQTQQSQGQNAAGQANNTQKPVNAGNSMVEQISVKITKAIQAGNDKITIQLRPANMGRVEVKMELSQDNRLVALVTADNRETLELLKNDSRALERALQDAGLHANAGDLNFNLRGQDNQRQDTGGGAPGSADGEEDFVDLDESIVETAVVASDGTVISNGRIDVRA